MKNLIRGTVAAMIATVGLFGSAMTVYAAPKDARLDNFNVEFTEYGDDVKGHEITEEEREKLHEQIRESAPENQLRKMAHDFWDFYEKYGDAVEEMLDGLL